MAEIKGKIFKIKRFSVHDGPGIRSSVFLKGCPLNCVWCHSPEGISSDISIWYNTNLCISCGSCVKACPEGAIQMKSPSEPYIEIDRFRCMVSGECVHVCPSNAIQFTGMIVTPDDVMSEAEKDIAFYVASGGGLTLTGGEPLFQPEFAFEILSRCRQKKIHTAIETSLFAETEVIRRISSVCDLIIADLKIFDSLLHKYFTGEANNIIKENFAFLVNSGKRMIVRVPMVKNITDNSENRRSIEGFVNSFSQDIPIEFIEFNPLAANNYKRLGIPFRLDDLIIPG